MSHVDEGALHAYLDGALEEYPTNEARRIRAHLEACGSCALRLEAERRIRRDASEILGLAVPNVHAPSFEELRAYVQATRPATNPSALRLYRLGWAASILVALGVGWAVRDGQLDGPIGDPGPAFVVAPVPSGEAAAREVGVEQDAGASQARRVDAEPEAEGFGVRSPRANEPGATSDVVRQEVDLTAPRLEMAAEDMGKASGDSVAELTSELADSRVSAEPGAVGGSQDRDDAFSRLQEEVVSNPAGLVDSLARDQAAGRLSGAASAGVASANEPLDRQRSVANTVVIDTPPPVPATVPTPEVTASRDEARRRAESAEPTVARLDAIAGPTSPSRPLDDAPADAESEAPLVVPGLDVISFANLAEGTTPSGLHILQRLDNGEILDVYHLPEGVDPSVLPPVEGGRNEVRAQRDGRWVILRAVLDTAALNELLARLDPEGAS